MRTKHRDMLEEILAEAEKKKLQAQLLVAANETADSGEVEGPAQRITMPSKHVLEDGALADSVSTFWPTTICGLTFLDERVVVTHYFVLSGS